MKSTRCEIIEYSIQIEHIHMVVIVTPSYKISEVIGRIKCQNASRIIIFLCFNKKRGN